MSRRTGLLSFLDGDQGPDLRRRMTRTHAVLWAVILVSTAADIVLTMVGLASGYEEGNLVVGFLVGELGLAGLFLVKFLAMCWLVGGWALLSDRNASIFLALFGSVTVAVSISNALLVLGG